MAQRNSPFLMAGIGRRIKKVRGSASQEQFAKLIGAPKQSYVSKYELGQSLSISVLIRIARAGSVSLDWLLTGKECEQKKQSAA